MKYYDESGTIKQEDWDNLKGKTPPMIEWMDVGDSNFYGRKVMIGVDMGKKAVYLTSQLEYNGI